MGWQLWVAFGIFLYVRRTMLLERLLLNPHPKRLIRKPSDVSSWCDCVASPAGLCIPASRAIDYWDIYVPW